MKPSLDLARGQIFNEVLQAIRLRSVVYCRAKWTAPWGYCTKTPSQPHFHFLTSGHCWLQLEDLIEPTPVREGDLVIVAPGQAYSMRDELIIARGSGHRVQIDRPDVIVSTVGNDSATTRDIRASDTILDDGYTLTRC
jgi:hypothetical protein